MNPMRNLLLVLSLCLYYHIGFARDLFPTSRSAHADLLTALTGNRPGFPEPSFFDPFKNGNKKNNGFRRTVSAFRRSSKPGSQPSGDKKPLSVNGNTYYVSPTGNDNNAGTITAPFKTIGKLNNILVAGDVAYIRGGTYLSTAGNGAEIHFQLNNLNGTATNPIKIWAYPGETPILSCSNITPTFYSPKLLVVDNCSYLQPDLKSWSRGRR